MQSDGLMLNKKQNHYNVIIANKIQTRHKKCITKFVPLVC